MKCSDCGYLNKGNGNCELCDHVMTIPTKKLKIKEENVKDLVKELDRVFSIFIRTRNMDANGIIKCFTCGKYSHWREGKGANQMHCGHYISRDNKPLRWHEKNNHPQCYVCNCEKKGNYPAYSQALIRLYGPTILDQLELIKYNEFKMERGKLKILINYYSKKIEHIK
jgi:hypothetical protein